MFRFNLGWLGMAIGDRRGGEGGVGGGGRRQPRNAWALSCFFKVPFVICGPSQKKICNSPDFASLWKVTPTLWPHTFPTTWVTDD